jgi:hypothetical protein
MTAHTGQSENELSQISAAACREFLFEFAKGTFDDVRTTIEPCGQVCFLG